MSRIIKAGATSQSIYIDVFDSTSTTGGRKTGLAYNTAGLTAYYVRHQGSATSITLATLAAANSAFSSGGFKEVDATNMPGVYRLDVPDAAIAASSPNVVIVLKGATEMVQVSISIQLVAVDPQDTVRQGLTALPNAAAEAAGGLYTRGTGAGQINQTNNGQVDANAARTGGTTNTGRDIGASVLLSSGTGTGQVTLTSGRVNADITHVAASAITQTGGRMEVNTTHWAGTAVGSANVRANVIQWNSSNVATPATAGYPVVTNKVGTGTGEINLSSGAVPVTGDLTATMKTSVTTAASAATPAVTVSDKTGFSLSTAGILAIWHQLTSAIVTASTIGKLIVDYLDATISSRSTYAGTDTSGTTTLLSRIVGTLASGTHNPQSGDNYARLGAPAGASVSADIAAVKSETAAIVADTNELQTDWANGGRLDNILDARASQTSVDTIDGIVDDILVDTGTDIPASIAGIGTAGGAAINVDATTDNAAGGISGVTSGTTKVGTETGTFANTSNVNGVYHQITHSGNDIDWVYQFLTGGGTNVVAARWVGYISGSNDTITFYAWNHVGAAWEAIGTQIGQAVSSNVTKDLTLYARHRGTSAAELGKVYIRLACTAQSSPELYTDQLFVSYAVTSRSVGYANGAVWIDTLNGVAGTESFVNGVADNPVLTLADALTIATANKLSVFDIANGSTITLGAATENKEFVGCGWILALGGQSVSASRFSYASSGVSGTCTGTNPFFFESSIGAVTLPPCTLDRCGLTSTLTLGSAGNFYLVDCFSQVAGTSSPVIDMGAAVGATNLSIRRWSGGLTINNIAAGDVISVDAISGGTITLNGADGNVQVRGMVNIVDNRTGTPTLGTTNNMDARFDTVDAALTAIVTDTNELQTDWADGGRLDNILDARASQTSVDTLDDYVDTEVAAIKAKTDLIPAAPAAVGDIPTVAEIADGVWEEDITDHSGTVDSTAEALANATAPTAAAVADAVWEEAIADHSGTTGSTAEALNAAGSSGDPWATALPGAYGSGSAGKIIGDNINATVSSRASQTSVDTIDDLLDTEVAAILADTNELQTDWANGGRLDTILDSAAADSSGVTTLLSRLTADRAGYLDVLNGIVASIWAAVVDSSGVTSLLSRLTATRAGYLDNLSGGAVATAAQINGLAVNTRCNLNVPVEIETPDASTQVFKIRLHLFDIEGNMEAPDSTPTIALTNAAGTDRSSRLSVASNPSTGVYTWDYTATAGDAEEQLVWVFTVVEGGLTRTYPATSYVVEETAYRFTSTDRANLVATLADTNELQADWADGGRLDSILDARASQSSVDVLDDYVDTEIAAIKAKTDNLPASPAATGDITAATSGLASQVSVDDLPTNAELATALGTADDATLAAIAALHNLSLADIRTAIGLASANLDTQLADLPTNSELTAALAGADDAVLAAVAALNNLSAAQVNAEVDTALADIHLDHLLAVDYDPASKPGTATALLNELVESDAGVSRFTANALEQAPTDGAAPSAAAIADAIWDEATAGHTTSGTFGEQLKTDVDAILADTNELQTNQGDWATATGFSTHSAADVWAVGTRTLTSFGSLVSDIATAVWGAATRTLSAFGFTVDTNANSTETAIKAKTDLIPAAPAAVGDIPTAVEVADVVWEEAIADHSGTTGSTAEALNAAGAEGDPWSTELPGAYGAGTAGKIVGENLDAKVSNVAALMGSPDAIARRVYNLLKPRTRR